MFIEIIPRKIIAENSIGFGTNYSILCEIPILHKNNCKVFILPVFSFTKLEEILNNIKKNFNKLIKINVNNINDLTMVPVN